MSAAQGGSVADGPAAPEVETVGVAGLGPSGQTLAVVAGGMVFTSALSAGHRPEPAGIEAEALVAVVDRVLHAAGSGRDRVAKVKATFPDMRALAGWRQAFEAAFDGLPIMSVCGGTPAVGRTVAVEIVAGVEHRPLRTGDRQNGARTLGPLTFAQGLPVDADGAVVGADDIAAAGEVALANLGAALRGAGRSLDDLVKVNNTAASWHGYGRFNAVYDRVLRGSQSARCTVSGALFDPLAPILMEAVAATGALRFVDSTRSGVGRSESVRDPRTVYRDDIGPCKGPHTHGARADDIVFIAGECPYDAQDRLVAPGDAAGQTAATFDNVRVSLEALGCTFAEVVKLNVTLSDPRLAPIFEAVFRETFLPPFPALAVVATPLGQPGILVEIEAVAVLRRGARRLAIVAA